MTVAGMALCYILFVSCPSAFALNPNLDISQYAHTVWKTRDGFIKAPNGSFAQTADGYLWFGTEQGLFRFDGVKVTPWRSPSGEQLPNNYIRNLLVSRDGTLWIGTLTGLASWRDGKLLQYPALAKDAVDALLEDDEGTIWVGTLNLSGGRLCAMRNGRVECQGEDGRFGRWVEFLYQDSRKNLWATTARGLWRWKPGPPQLILTPSQISGSQQTVIEDDKGTLLFATVTGIQQYVDGKIGAYTLPVIQGQTASSRIFRDRDGGVWMARIGAAGLVHMHAGKTDLFTRSDGLSGDSIGGFFEDREGNVWVATNEGLDRFRDITVVTLSVKQGLSSAVVGPVLADRDGSVWIGNPDGLGRWKNGESSDYGDADNKHRRITPYALFQDNHGRIWVANIKGVSYLENKRFVSVPGIPGGPVRGFAEDNAGTLWIAGVDSGLLRITARNEIQVLPWTSLGLKDFATAIATDPLQGGLWLGFYDGGIAYFADGSIRESYSAADGLGEGFVGRLRLDPDGTVWAATQGGLSRLRKGRIATMTSKNGLPCDAVQWVIRDNDQSFWLYMPCGLVRITRAEIDTWASAADEGTSGQRTIQATVFGSSDGVLTEGFPGGYSPQVTRSPDGKLWFRTSDGVSIVDPGGLAFNKLPPPVHIEQITADRKVYEVAAETNGSLRLPSLSRDLQIEYTALSLVAPEKIRFRYKLEGYDKDWQDVGNRRQAFYTNLSPRTYRFRVIACNNSGVWNETGTFLDFSIAPAYYQTAWFRLAVGAALLIALAGLYRLRVRHLATIYKGRMEERVHERERIARDLHDTFLQSVQGLILKFDAAAKQIPHEEPARKAMESALDRADEVMAEGRDRVRNLRDATVSLGDLSAAFRRVVEENSKDGKVTFTTLAEGKFRDLNPIVLEESYAIGREALINALTHSEGHNIEAEITYDRRQFRLRIRDDGKGIDPKILQEGGRPDHFGLPGMRERADRIDAQLNLWSGADTGTEVELLVPATTAYRRIDVEKRRSWFRFR